MNEATREYKSNTFSLLMKVPEYALQTYNYLNGTDYEDTDCVEMLDVDGGFVLSVRSDRAFIVDTNLSIYEHQSTINPNMPLRLLVYVSNAFRYLTRNQNIYGEKLIKIPNPSFVVFYNGIKKYPEKQVLKLSDSYENTDKDIQLELSCTVLNIHKGYNEDIKKNVPAIYGYCEFVAKVRKYSLEMEIKEAVSKAVDECIKEDILAEFFKENKDMIISTEAVDYTYERRLELVARDSRAEGLIEGRTEGITEGLERGRKESEAKIAKSEARIAESEAKIAELTAKLEAAGIKP